uniref:tRNA-specific 2-thiouridylase MnmA n=1 Tax=Chlorobium chlorochromatii (strain CaD3) TaxID=340177 RepID=MNMA_CHLCH|nr:RecName: Full=tRNA-specific 2-thiouridylase MnmA [Chlorobium chlorochromatii CaD3]
MSTPHHILVGISGGVDSAVATCLLVQQGYRVTAVNLRLLDTLDAPYAEPTLQPSSLVVSDHPDYHIPLFSLNLSRTFRDEVMRYFNAEYLAGRTPNPCMVCNRQVKWAGLRHAAELIGANAIATGHYANRAFSDGRYRLYKGADSQKDQSYFLWMLSQKDLAHTLLPLGGLTKPEVRELAKNFGVRAAEKKESQEICFVPNDDYSTYLMSAMPELAERVADGDIVDAAGTVIGKHRGYPFYTIGQRRGLGVSAKEPLYVTALDAEQNRIHVGHKAALMSHRLLASRCNWIGMEPPSSSVELLGRIRYRDRQTACRVTPLENGQIEVVFQEPKSAITPGQAVVFYCGDEVLGGGFIEEGT